MSERQDGEERLSRPQAAPADLEAHYPQLYRFLLRALRSGEHQTAQDLAQDTYVRFLSLAHPEQVRQPRAYLLRIAVNLVTEYRLRNQRIPVVFDSDLASAAAEREGANAWEDLLGEGLQLRRRFEQILRQMPAMQRAVAVLWMRDHASLAQIAARTGLTEQTARKYLTRALALLQAAGKGSV